MKKKILLITCIISTISILSIIIFNSMDNKNNNIMKNIDKDNQIVKENMITMMYETEAGSGNYELTKDTTWPETGYVFNSELSGCEGNGELSWNNENHTVNLLTNTADRCFVYFDKYSGVWIDNVEVSTITGNSITLNVNATSDNGTIVAYYYSINNSQYVESTSNIIQITDLNKVTEYNIKVYAIDSANNRSNIYTLDTTTTADSGPSISFVLINELTENSVTLSVSAISQNPISKYYYSINNGNYTESSNSMYTFGNLAENTNYQINIYIEDTQGNSSDKYNISITTGKKTIFFADYIKSLSTDYTSQGFNGIYYHTIYLANSAQDNSYRYSGANPNNYVCFGSTAATCPNGNLYRIIGVFGDEIKLIKNTSIGTYRWTSTSSSVWNASTKPQIYTRLNDTYLNTFSSTWQNKIANHTWEVGGMESDDSYTAKEYYDIEVGINQTGYEETMKVGLMYVSDYGFAASNSYWKNAVYAYDNYSVRENNWMYLGSTEWTISRSAQTFLTGFAFYIYSSGGADDSNSGNSSSTNAVRPCFYLNADVLYASGDGSQSNPFRIEV